MPDADDLVQVLVACHRTSMLDVRQRLEADSDRTRELIRQVLDPATPCKMQRALPGPK
ncbi:MAG: hypothetical protein HY020_23225 [Burkholderiales bacterium]|nr:hypothetical protein [Burkholderiales bacterium]